MHISCCRIGCPINRSHKQSRGQYHGIGTITARQQLLISSHLIGLINLLILGTNCVGLHASPAIGPRPGLTSFVGSDRQVRWNDNTRPSPLPAVGGGGSAGGIGRLQPYQIQLRQPPPTQAAVGVVPGGSQQQPLIRQLTTSTLPPLTAQTSPQRTTLIRLIENGTTTTQTPRPPVVGLPPAPPPNPIINHHNHNQHQRAQQLLRQPPYYEQQVFAPTATNKQVAQPQNLQQNPQRVYATKQTPTTASLPSAPVTTTTTTTTTTAPPAYRNSDVTPELFSCLGCDPRGWPLFKSLVSLQNPLLLGGDILVRTSGTKRRPVSTGMRRLYKSSRSALVDPVSLWPNGVIFYELDESVGHLAALIWRVMQHFHVHTCIRFVPRRNNEPDFIRIGAHRGCSSYIGRIGGEQVLSLGDGCEFRGTIAHELLHAVGFYHHQNRSDRDDFLEILWENVAKGKEDQFRKMSADENFLLNEFDYNSIMLYGPHTFGKTLDKITMKPKREGVILLELIEKRGLSALDIDSVNKLYKCDGSVGLGYDLAPEQPAAAPAAAAASSR